VIAAMNSPGQSVWVGDVLVGWASAATADTTAVPLGPIDNTRAAGLSGEQKARFLQGRTLLHRLLGELQPGVVPQLDATTCPHCSGPHGPVSVEGPAVVVGLAHADGLVVAAVATTSRVTALGLDAERDAVGAAERLADLVKLIGGSPATALRRWTQIEAVLKADGRGLRVPPEQVRIEAETAQIESDPDRYRLAEISGPAGYLISLAWR